MIWVFAFKKPPGVPQRVPWAYPGVPGGTLGVPWGVPGVYPQGGYPNGGTPWGALGVPQPPPCPVGKYQNPGGPGGIRGLGGCGGGRGCLVDSCRSSGWGSPILCSLWDTLRPLEQVAQIRSPASGLRCQNPPKIIQKVV